MKKILFFAAMAAMLLNSCADSKTFRKQNGTEFTAQPYGWMNGNEKVKGVNYEICTTNIVLSIIFGETVVAPVLLTGLELYEPVDYNER